MKKIILFLFIIISTFSCNNNNVNNEEKTLKNSDKSKLRLDVKIGTKKDTAKLIKTSLIQEWFPNANYAGELVAEYKMDEKYGLDLKIIAGSDELNPITLVSSGDADFGIVSADRLLEANEKGANLVSIAVANYKSPTCFISKKSDSILTPKDFYGKKIGILTGTNTEIIYRLLIKSEKLNERKLDEVEAPFDLGTFILGSYDLRPAFIYDEPVSLDLQNIEYNILKPEDFNIKFMGTVYFCKESLLLNNPKKVQAFVNSIRDGWEYTFNHPIMAITLLKKYDNSINTIRESMSLLKAIPYFKGENNKLLYASEDTWNEMAHSLIKLGKIKKFNYKKSVNYKFLKNK